MNVADTCARCAAVCFERNPVIARMLGLCPLLAIVASLRDALLYGTFFVTVLVVSTTLACLTRHLVVRPLRLLWLQLLAAASTAWLAAWALAGAWTAMAPYGIYLGLVAANCLLLDYAQARAGVLSLPALLRDLAVTAGTVWVGVLAYGMLRGALGGDDAAGPVPLLAAPAGALLLLGLIAAGVNALRPGGTAPRAAGGSVRDDAPGTRPAQ